MSAPKSRARRIVEVALAALVLVALFVFSEGLLRRKVGPSDEAGLARRAPHAGAVAAVETRQVAITVETAGSVRPRIEATIAARVTGRIDAVEVAAGSTVRAGQVLARLAVPELGARSAAAAGATRAAEASLEQARRDLARMEALAAREAATRVEVEQARTAVAAGEGRLAQARSAERAEASLAADAVVRAPFDGIVQERRVEAGDLAAPGLPLFVVAAAQGHVVEAFVDEASATALAVGREVDVAIDALDLRLPGRISEIVPEAHAGSRTVLVKAGLPDTPGLRAGLFARLRFTTGSRPVVVVPRDAVTIVGGLSVARVVADDGTSITRSVRLGGEVAPGFVEVLSGLAAGERVAVDLP